MALFFLRRDHMLQSHKISLNGMEEGVKLEIPDINVID